MSSRRRTWHDHRVLALTRGSAFSDPEEAIKSLCEALIDEAGDGGPPFNPEILASFRGVVAVRRIPLREAGRLIPSTKGFEIEVNIGHTIEKQNFSINHESCHTFFEESGPRQTRTDLETGAFDARKEEEFLCDLGASALLFDSRWFRPMASCDSPGTLTHL